MLVFRSASRPAAGLALAISLSLHGGPWRARGQWGCQVNVQNDIPGVGIQVTAFDADDGVCDDYYGQYAVAPGQGKRPAAPSAARGACFRFGVSRSEVR
jgi:hypothetical protein